MLKYIFTLLLILPLWANTLSGKVVKIVDGDTVHLLLKNNSIEKIRLAGIDAPERKQAHGKKAKKYLSSMISNKSVYVTYNKVDRYGRIVGKILFDDLDINLKMVQAGYAWHYKKYEKEQTPDDRIAYSVAENNARRHKIGLFQNKAIPPWEWRKNKKNKRKLKPKASPKILAFSSNAKNVKVWVNLNSKKYHCPNTRYYENTKKGELILEKLALQNGYSPAHGIMCH